MIMRALYPTFVYLGLGQAGKYFTSIPNTHYSMLARNIHYDWLTCQVIKKSLKPGTVAIDVGAKDGVILREIVRRAPRSKHIAIEPIPALATQLRSKFPDVCVHNVALSNTVGRASFYHVINASGYSGLRRMNYDFPAITEEIRVDVHTLDSLGIEQPVSFIKIDVEGAEFHVLQGGESLLRQKRPIVVFEALEKTTGLYGVSPREIFSFLTNHIGMSVSTISRWLKKGDPYSEKEFIENWKKCEDFYFIAY